MKLRKPKAIELLELIPADIGDPEMVRSRGRAASRVMLIAPPCDPLEYKHGLPFCNESAEIFHHILEEHRLNTQKDFFVISCSRFGLKPSKHSTDLMKYYILACAEEDLFDYFVCVGETAFKFLFGGGRKPSSSTLIANVLYVKETNRKPLFTFPDTALLVAAPTKTDWEAMRAERMAEEFNVKFRRYAQKLAKLLSDAGLKK